ncbi:S9 family peptidase [Hufsiella ginkgonis]|uniref:Prolyl oligopeptidase family serine peptidase n=1 Tax=Hufsiella ginkgonis TaxID=2695274 RepID=A0A7K1Y314_9SPHI|nr:prolyl oligopeptidase family serine peptidase [Hufsiella ginkgonis]MXV17684.1 prolyl oligopeptidase family serine peptidase [Hufsiella ginkgonis]
MKKLLLILLVVSAGIARSQTLDKLTVEKIMRDPVWMGTSPDNVRWTDDSKKLYFSWNPENADRAPLYAITPSVLKPVKVSDAERNAVLPAAGVFNKKLTQKLYERNGDLFIVDVIAGVSRQLSNTVEQESNPRFSFDETKVLFMKGDNLFSMNLTGGELVQYTNFTRQAAGAAPAPVAGAGRGQGGGFGGGGFGGRQGGGAAGQAQSGGNKQDTWLRNEQLGLFEVIREKDKDAKTAAAERRSLPVVKRPKEIALGDRTVSQVTLSGNNRFITYRLTRMPEGGKSTVVPSYVTASGYTEDLPSRAKVGTPQPTYESYVYDTLRDTVYSLVLKDIPGIKDLPDYVKDYPKQLEDRKSLNADRAVVINGPVWSPDGNYAVVIIGAQDNKDRWIMKLDPVTGKLSLIDRQRDEAWIGGPGISGQFGGGTAGWTDNQHFFFQSEATGYSHVYLADVVTNKKVAVTSGKWEVQSLRLSNDKKHFYFTANIQHPGITHYYKVPVTGGTPVQLTTMKGGNEVSLSPDEKWLAIRYSYSNKPWELYVQENKPGAAAVQVTNSTTGEFRSYAWRDPEMISFKNRYGADVYARLYQPKTPDPARPAVVFVHGAGYLQNVHYWWSQYFREYMFNNFLADNGYTVLDIDYTGSSGYGRDHRTGIYRHMGGKDLTDQVDGVKLLVEKYGVNPKHVGLYGGSYGGFITLMALFTEPDVFASGAGLRSVTDWAHYNHGYTANILNEPYNDEKAYQQSSPINFADGLKGRLLMCHGMVDVNVNFQDVVRLSQKLIELKKDNWELAVYPVEDHGFTEPSSWTDEYKRIYKLFEETLKK